MGFVLSKFRKSKTSVKDKLDEIDTDLRKLSRYQYDTELQQKRIVGRVVIGGVFIYLIALTLIYLFGPRDLTWKEMIGWVTPLILFPFIIIIVKRILTWYFNRKIVKNKQKYEGLKKEKQQLLDEVMEKETFKVAKEILEKYAPNHLLPKYLADQQKSSPQSLTPIPRTAQGLRRRSNAPLSGTPTPIPYPAGAGGFTPRAIRPTGPPGMGPPMPRQFLRQPMNNFMRPAIMPGPNTSTPNSSPALVFNGPPPPRFMLPSTPLNPQFRTRTTGWIDKLVDYVVGDGPANRFALICRYCATHNGLAVPEDFPYIGYRCVHCRQFNPPKQQRPSAPTLPRNTVLIEEMDSTIKSPETSLNKDNEAENEEDSKTEDNDDSKLQDSPKKNLEEDSEHDGDPIVELAASSVEDLTRSADSVPTTDGGEQSQSEVEDLQNDDEEEDEGNSQSNDVTVTHDVSKNDLSNSNESSTKSGNESPNQN